jgi:hypothetical protein
MNVLVAEGLETALPLRTSVNGLMVAEALETTNTKLEDKKSPIKINRAF